MFLQAEEMFTQINSACGNAHDFLLYYNMQLVFLVQLVFDPGCCVLNILLDAIMHVTFNLWLNGDALNYYLEHFELIYSVVG